MSKYLDKTASLSPLARRIICEKATEYPNTGVYNDVKSLGTYLCRRCGLALFRGYSQFSSGCGWPSFDESISSAVKELLDEDGLRTEIVCSRCHAHLGQQYQSAIFFYNQDQLGSVDISPTAYVPRLVPERSTRKYSLRY